MDVEVMKIREMVRSNSLGARGQCCRQTWSCLGYRADGQDDGTSTILGHSVDVVRDRSHGSCIKQNKSVNEQVLARTPSCESFVPVSI